MRRFHVVVLLGEVWLWFCWPGEFAAGSEWLGLALFHHRERWTNGTEWEGHKNEGIMQVMSKISTNIQSLLRFLILNICHRGFCSLPPECFTLSLCLVAFCRMNMCFGSFVIRCTASLHSLDEYLFVTEWNLCTRTAIVTKYCTVKCNFHTVT